MKNLFKNKSGEKFGFGIFIVIFAISISLFSFISEDSNITGFAIQENQNQEIKATNLQIFRDINSLGSLAVGNYFVDENGIVYWDEDSSKTPVAKISYLDENQKNREIHIDKQGRIGYILGNFVNNQNEK